ncbi:hypothetical protein F4680DRAFT_399394 [Xylaria scruposa]|nr:hypothetical protein F4680DRAFT_399394 [Xylaria scruposa]
MPLISPFSFFAFSVAISNGFYSTPRKVIHYRNCFYPLVVYIGSQFNEFISPPLARLARACHLPVRDLGLSLLCCDVLRIGACRRSLQLHQTSLTRVFSTPPSRAAMADSYETGILPPTNFV